MTTYKENKMELTTKLTDLKLHYLAGNLDSFLTGTKDPEGALDVITRMSDLELMDKATRSTERRLKAAKIGVFKPLEEIDWAWSKGLERGLAEHLMKLDFLSQKRNIVIAGAQGLGKTMLAQNLAFRAAASGHSTLFTTASKLVLDLSSQESSAALQRKLAKYERLKLLVIDELGYLNFTDRAADFIFEIINRRYEKGSIVITTNLAFTDWHKVFPGAPCVTAMVDRLTHHADIIKLSGESFRKKEAAAAGRGKKNSS